MTTRPEEIDRAVHAQQILSDPLVSAAMSDIKATVIEQWRLAPIKDRDYRDALWAIYCGATKFEELLRSHIETGKLAKQQLEIQGHPV